MIIWQNTEDYLFGKTKNFKYKHKIASFDLDGTLIVTRSKKKYPISANDWMFFSDNVVTKLTELIESDYCIIIVSNQAGLNAQSKIAEWITKLSQIQVTLNIEFLVFCSVKNNEYRKPLPQFFLNEDFFPQNIFLNKHDKSFYCGDACGRNGDHANTDLKFAKNSKLIFKTPEFLFDGEKQIIPKINYPDVKKYLNLKPDFIFEKNLNPEMIIMVGFPASGKSSIASFLQSTHNYFLINQDNLKTKSKCFKVANEYMKKSQCVVIDNTNKNKEIRGEWINLAIKYNYNVRCILLNVDYDLAMHNNVYRYLTTQKYIPKMVYNMYKSSYEPPELSEGYKEIIVVNKPCSSKNIDKDIYLMYMY